MKSCQRCGKWFHGTDSEVCDPCWVDMGQLSFWHDEDKDVEADQYDEATGVGPDPDGEDYWPPIDTVFDREAEARGYQ